MSYICTIDRHINTIKTKDLNINDIVTYRVKDEQIFSKIIHVTQTMYKVKNLNIDIKDNRIYFFEKEDINSVTKNYLSKTRKILKII